MNALPPQMIIVGGPNGAGKTTFVLETLKRRSIPYLGADQIAAEMSPADPAKAALAAGREFILRLGEMIESQQTFIVETTLSGKSFLGTIRRARQCGYWITIQMVFVDSPTRSIGRVAARVRRGGHHVPSTDVRRRFPRALQNFWLKYRQLADEWLLTYNGEDLRRDVAKCSQGDMVIVDRELLRLFYELGEIDSDHQEAQ